MGYYVEVNTLVRLPSTIDTSSLKAGMVLTTSRERERIVPLHIALLLIDADWNFYGYCRVNSIEVRNQATIMKVEILSIFRPHERELYKSKFIEAAKVTGEIK